MSASSLLEEKAGLAPAFFVAALAPLLPSAAKPALS
jgi:hypothetical protein